METKEHLLQTLEHFKQQRNLKLQEISSLDVMIRGLQQELGDAAPTAETADYLTAVQTPASPNANGGSTQVRPDEFFSMTQTEAAKLYLKKVGRAISIDQLLDGMMRGGARVGGANPKFTLYVSLMRNPKREFVKVGDGFIGLREFYPGLPKSIRNGTKKISRGRTKKAKRRSISRKPILVNSDVSKPDDSTAAIDVEQPQLFPRVDKSKVKDALRKILGDGQSLTTEAILKAVNHQLGFKVKPIIVIGCLRGKEFELNDEKYMMKK